MVQREYIAWMIALSKHTKLVCKTYTKDSIKSTKRVEYCVCPENNLSKSIMLTPETVRYFLSECNGRIEGLKITSDKRIFIDKNIGSHTINAICKSEESEAVFVGALIAGNIMNQGVYTRVIKQTKGEISSSISGALIVGTDYILNDEKIAEIKKYYSDSCIVRIKNAYEVRESIITNTQFRKRLAIFYAKQMREARYIHTNNIRSSKALKTYEIIRKRFMNSSFLEKDPNLLLILFILYGHHMYTFEHSVNVAIYSCMLYGMLYMNKTTANENLQNLQDLFVCGLLHDIGKIDIPIHIIDKPGRLTDEEFNLIQQHPTTSYYIVKQLCMCDSKIFSEYKNNPERAERIINGAYYHHRDTTVKPNKTNWGYPKELDIVLDNEKYAWFYRIIKTADVLDGMQSPRPYRARKGQKPKNNQREYLGIVKIINVYMADSVEKGSINKKEYKALAEMIYVDDMHETDDEYGSKLVNIKFNKDIIRNYRDITKMPGYKEN